MNVAGSRIQMFVDILYFMFFTHCGWLVHCSAWRWLELMPGVTCTYYNVPKVEVYTCNRREKKLAILINQFFKVVIKLRIFPDCHSCKYLLAFSLFSDSDWLSLGFAIFWLFFFFFDPTVNQLTDKLANQKIIWGVKCGGKIAPPHKNRSTKDSLVDESSNNTFIHWLINN